MADNLDMENRDPNAMNSYIQVTFGDVLAEPEGAHSAQCVWRNAYKCFEGGLSCCYKLLTYICGLPAALLWGCCFACLAFQNIWCLTPLIRVFNIQMVNPKRLNSICMSTFIAPQCEAWGMLFSRIQVVNSTGDPPAPIGVMDHKVEIHSQVKRMK